MNKSSLFREKCITILFQRLSLSLSLFFFYEWFITAVCESCLEERLEEERRSQLVYSRAAIYVRQVDKIGALTDNLMDVPSTSAISTSIAEDPDFQV